jgi:polyisoprenoid-binding protein YceI
MKRFLTILIIALFSMPALAQSVPSWRIIRERSELYFEGTQLGAAFKGNFKDFDGDIQFDPNNLAGSKADIVIGLATVDAHSADRNKYLQTEDWFNTAKFPQAHFVTTEITKTNDGYMAKGNLTIRDVTLPIELPFTLAINNTQAQMTGTAKINRLAFHLGDGQWKDPQTVGTDVSITIKLIAERN